jgi:hypothetical protein
MWASFFNNVPESVEKKDGSISNDTSDKTPRQDAMNWFASCSCNFIHTAFLNHPESKLAHIANF